MIDPYSTINQESIVNSQVFFKINHRFTGNRKIISKYGSTFELKLNFSRFLRK